HGLALSTNDAGIEGDRIDGRRRAPGPGDVNASPPAVSKRQGLERWLQVQEIEQPQRRAHELLEVGPGVSCGHVSEQQRPKRFVARKVVSSPSPCACRLARDTRASQGT